jgi:radical SAM superfamily enzyme YgiQ (UPF0313 family)
VMIIKNEPQKLLKGGKKALLIHPPIYDTQYWAYWAQPHGLLKVATWLNNNNYSNIRLLDCLATNKKREVASTQKEKIEVGNIKRTMKHFGWSLEKLEFELNKHADPNNKDSFYPDEIWITSIMTYWWQSTRDIIKLIEDVFSAKGNRVPRILVGGIYPTLYPEHADLYLREGTNLTDEDLIIVDGEICEDAASSWTDLSLYKDEVYDTFPKYSLITGSRGCPFDCAYCAQLRLNQGNRRVRDRGSEEIAAEMWDKFKTYGVGEFAFYEDNLLFNRQEFLERLEAIRKKFGKNNITIYAPEGIEPRLVEREMMTAMRKTGFKKIHLALETIDNEIAIQWNRRQATIEKFDGAIDILQQSGFKVGGQDINAFVLFGMPEENIQAAMNTALYASTRVGSVVPMLFTPVPGSRMFEKYLPYLRETYKGNQDNTKPFRDLHLLNGKLLPFLKFNQEKYPDLKASDYLDIESLMMHLNSSKVYAKRFDINSNSIVGQVFTETIVATP